MHVHLLLAMLNNFIGLLPIKSFPEKKNPVIHMIFVEGKFQNVMLM